MIEGPFAKLTWPSAEAAYRLDSLDRDRRVAKILILVAVAFHAVSMPTDAVLVEDPTRLRLVWGVRAASAAFGLGALWALQRRSSVRYFENLVFVWALQLLAGVVAANAMLPADYTIHLGWDILLTLAVYTVLPLGLERQLLAAAMMTLGDLALFLGWKDLAAPGALSDVALVFACANLVGAITAWQMHRASRLQYAALMREKAALVDLQQAMDEIRTLRGIIPICASCKQVRTDAGDWKQVEAYVRDHSHADFSHGLCPTCATTIYGEYADEAEPGPA